MNNTTHIVVKSKYDDPVGIWYQCEACDKQFHIAYFNEDSTETELFKYCPYCGRKIINVIDNG